MHILFARHGHSTANRDEIISNRTLPHPLTAQGRQQAKDLAAALQAHNVTTVYASPIPRALETAQIVCRGLGLDFTTTPALREFDCGIGEGRGDPGAWDLLFNIVDVWDVEGDHAARIPEGESYEDIRARFIPFIHELIASQGEQDGDILLVSHFGTLALMLPVLVSNLTRAYTKSHHLPNCGLVVVEIGENGLVCTSWDGVKPD